MNSENRNLPAGTGAPAAPAAPAASAAPAAPAASAAPAARRAKRSPKSKIMVSVRLTPYLYQETARIARQWGCSLSLAVRALLQYAIDSEDHDED